MEKPKNSPKPLKTNSTEVVHKNPWFKVVHNRIRNLKGIVFDYFSIHTNETNRSVLVIAVENGEIYLVNQYRYLLGEWSLEVPGGGVEKDQTILEAAEKELREEMGITAAKTTVIGKFAPWPGKSPEICYVVLATGLKQKTQNLEETEKDTIKIEKMEIYDFLEMARKGELVCGVTSAALLQAETRLIELDSIADRKKLRKAL